MSQQQEVADKFNGRFVQIQHSLYELLGQVGLEPADLSKIMRTITELPKVIASMAEVGITFDENGVATHTRSPRNPVDPSVFFRSLLDD